MSNDQRARDLEAARDAERVEREASAREREEEAEKERGEAAVADGVAAACDAAEVLGDREWEYGAEFGDVWVVAGEGGG
jgi:hypothetical protein